MQQLLDAFVDAARRGDAAAAASLVSTRDPTFAGRAAIWSANLGRIEWRRLTWSAEPAQMALAGPRRAMLGEDAWVQQVRLTWAFPGETRTAQETIWLTFVDQPTADGGEPVTRLVGDGDGPTAATPMPIWLQQPVRLLRRGSALLLADARDADSWLGRASAADRAVATRVGRAGRDSEAVLVVELAASRAIFERALGVPAGSYATIAAAAWPMGPDPGTAPIHVLVNPEASGRLSTLGRNVLLTHEAVHVVTRSPGSPVPTWLVEGYADQIAYRVYPAGSKPAEESVREFVREDGAPRDWPDEDDFAPDAGGLGLTYDLAWTAARSIARTYGDDGLDQFYADVDRGDSLAEAADALGTSAAMMREQWRSDLAAAARR